MDEFMYLNKIKFCLQSLAGGCLYFNLLLALQKALNGDLLLFCRA